MCVVPKKIGIPALGTGGGIGGVVGTTDVSYGTTVWNTCLFIVRVSESQLCRTALF